MSYKLLLLTTKMAYLIHLNGIHRTPLFKIVSLSFTCNNIETLIELPTDVKLYKDQTGSDMFYLKPTCIKDYDNFITHDYCFTTFRRLLST